MMEFFKKIVAYIQQLSQKNFYTYSGIYVGGVVILSLLLILRYYSNSQYLIEQNNNINDQRERVQQLLTDAQQVQKQKTEVNKMIEQDEDFNILAYFQTTLAKLGLNKHLGTIANTRTDREDNYTEEEAKAQLSDLTMKQLTELLQEIEQNKRIYSKELEIVKSKKRQNTIEISITIATLIKKTVAATG
jgi:hypothetical protein